jgi:hypothetical protein
MSNCRAAGMIKLLIKIKNRSNKSNGNNTLVTNQSLMNGK